MHVRYGSYAHAEGEVELAWERDPIRSEGGDLLAIVTRASLSGQLLSDSESNMDAAWSALVAAYVDGQDLALVYTATGDTSLLLESARCNGGTRVTKPPSLPPMRGPAYSLILPYSIVVEGEEEVTNRDTDLLSFTESLTVSGGGPRFAVRETLDGYPIRQQVRAATTFRATQSGSATGLYGYPIVPPPLFPGAMVEAPQVTRVTPRRRGASGTRLSYTEYAVQWQYQYESPGPLGRNFPTVWR